MMVRLPHVSNYFQVVFIACFGFLGEYRFNCVLTNSDADDKHIVVFKDKETSARTNCQNENKPSDLKCSSQVQSAAVVDTDNDKTTESSNEKGDVRVDESLPL
jgi:hypothetical protein